MKKIAIILFIIPLIISCNRHSDSHEGHHHGEGIEHGHEGEHHELPPDIVEMREDQIKLAGIKLGVAEDKITGNELKVNGVIGVSPQNQATVSAQLGGYVISTNLLPGSVVKKGSTLAVIENQDFLDLQQNYLEVKSKLEFAEGEYNRHKQLYTEKVYSEKNLQQVTSEYKILKAQINSLRQKLNLIGINPDKLNEDNINSRIALTSPINGYIKNVNVNIGKFVSPTDVLFEIVNNENLFLELSLFEKDANQVKAGQEVIFYVNNEEEEHKALIHQTVNAVSQDKIFRVFANIQGNCKNLMPGLFANAIIKLNQKSALSLPDEAVVSFEDKSYIFVLHKEKTENGKKMTEFKMIEVEKGNSSDGFTEIKLPNQINITTSNIVIKGAYTLLSAKKNSGDMAC